MSGIDLSLNSRQNIFSKSSLSLRLRVFHNCVILENNICKLSEEREGCWYTEYGGMKENSVILRGEDPLLLSV